MARYLLCWLFLASALAFKIAVTAELDDDIFAKEKTLKEGPMFNRTTSAAVVKDWAWSTMMTLYNISFPGASPTSKFYDAAIQITKEVATAHAAAQRSPDEAVDIKRLIKYMTTASDSKNNDLARSALARTLYGFFKAFIGGAKLPLGLDAISFSAAHFLETLKDRIGPKKFNELVARDGSKTLAFAIDTTGSMTDDIKAAKAITKAIIAEERTDRVDFVLSPFADPGFGPVVYKTEDEGNDFIGEIDKLVPRGGGDCPEMAFQGILEALNAGPQFGSPLFVITDASAKDDTPTNVKMAKVIAQSTGIIINFFTKPKGCDRIKGIDAYRDIAEFTAGQVFPLTSDKELRNLTAFVKDSLETTQIISMSRTFTRKKKPVYSRRRGRRSLTANQFPLEVDEFAAKLQVTVTTEEEMKPVISLVDPKGHQRMAQVNLSHSLVYSIENPMRGRWMLKIPRSVGKYDYIARVKSRKVIEFGYYYVMVYNGISSPIEYPLKHEMSRIFATVGGAEHTNISTLSIRLEDPKGFTIQKGIEMKPMGTVGIHFQATFMPPMGKYKVILEGKTLGGTKFTRMSKSEDEAKTVLLRVLYGQNHFTALPGRRFLLLVGLHNNGPTEFFKVKCYSDSGQTKVLKRRVLGRRGRMGFVIITLKPFKHLKPGATATVFLLLRGERSRTTITEAVRVLLVDF